MIVGGDEFTDWRRGGAGLLGERQAHPGGSVEKSGWVGGNSFSFSRDVDDVGDA